jgi:hypothetical protein
MRSRGNLKRRKSCKKKLMLLDRRIKKLLSRFNKEFREGRSRITVRTN